MMMVQQDPKVLEQLGDELIDDDNPEAAWVFYGAQSQLEGVSYDSPFMGCLERVDFETDDDYEAALQAWQAGWRIAAIFNGFPILAQADTTA